ncbi:LADA_0F12156g1_1 [Lachancea dasiensis]|uniref:LADA_0F12156g1_1 n=1 Tax=Lachancea dasiensis TaxID=1072105 RepID=A0A1G4JMF0_9SACH|nr:LADA_0F12156g1_1 [Lachancea dasiensis]
MAKGQRSKRSAYSHNGCKQCKQRKVKCDERRPRCWQCERLNKECGYLADRNSRMEGNNGRRSADSGEPSTQGSRSFLSNNENTSDFATMDHTNVPLDSADTANDSGRLDSLSLFSVAEDLSEIVNLRLEEMVEVPNLTDDLDKYLEGDTIENISGIPSVPLIQDVPISHLNVQGHDTIYLHQFYHHFADILLPFQVTIDGKKGNPLRDLLMIYARETPYLLCAILACGARLSHRKTALLEDQQNYKFYLQSCLQFLTSAMANNLASQTEHILLTVLTMTCDGAMGPTQNWRFHLKGAKGLLVNISKFDFENDSPALIVCKLWFSSIEILAGLTSPLGGTLATDEEFNLLLSLTDKQKRILYQANFIHSNDFILFHGFTVDLMACLKDVIKVLQDKRDSKQNLELVIDLLAALKKEASSGPALVNWSESNIFPCHYVARHAQELPTRDMQGVIFFKAGEASFDWPEVCQQAYIFAAMILILTSVLETSKDSEVVQQLVSDLLVFADLISGSGDPPKYTCLFSLQWPMYIAGLNSTRAADRLKAEKFFRLLAEIYSGSACALLEKLKRSWYGKNEDKQNHPDYNLDVVAY